MEKMMLDVISLKDFKSYKSAELHLAPLTLLIGANASGKSNALEAIRILSWLASGRRTEDIGRGMLGENYTVRGYREDILLHPDKPFELGCRIAEPPEGWGSLIVRIALFNKGVFVLLNEEVVRNLKEEEFLYKVDENSNLGSEEVNVFYNNFKNDKNKPLTTCSNRQAIFYQLDMPGRFDKKYTKSQKLIPAVARSMRESLRKIVFINPHPPSMRGYSYIGDDEMNEDGSNVSSVIFKVMHTKDKIGAFLPKKHLLDFVASIPEQGIEDIDFIKTKNNDVMLFFNEYFGNKQFVSYLPLLSDGTLRVLAVAGTLLTVPEGSLVVIEEIDNGIHPSRASDFLKSIRKIAELRKLRVLLTAHNPAMVNALPDESLKDVLCCYRDPEEGDSRIMRLQEMSRYPELIALAPLGELMTKGTLERFLKDKTTPEERKEEALRWLDALEKEGLE